MDWRQTVQNTSKDILLIGTDALEKRQLLKILSEAFVYVDASIERKSILIGAIQ